jgi:hypothetical protein
MLLTQRIDGFIHRDYNRYYLCNENLMYLEEGNLVSLNLVSRVKIIYDFCGELTEISFLGDGQMFAKVKNEKVHYFDLNWLNHSLIKLTRKINVLEHELVVPLWKPLLEKSAPSLLSKFEGDPVHSKVACFVGPQTLHIFGSLSQTALKFEGCHAFKERFIALNLHESKDGCPSDFKSIVCALDGTRNQVHTWELGTGKLIDKALTLVDDKDCQDYFGFKRHMSWDNFTLVSKDSTQWIKIQVH